MTDRAEQHPTAPDPAPSAGPPSEPPEVQPLDVDGVRTMFVGMIGFTVAFLVLLPFHASLAAHGRTWWLWTTLVGAGLGLIGWRRCLATRRRRAGSGEPPPGSPDPAAGTPPAGG